MEVPVSVNHFSLRVLAVAFIVFGVVSIIKCAFAPGLRSIPGPFLARYTNAWRLYGVYRGDYEKCTIELHKLYGDIVRIGPQTISIADPAMIEPIYGLKANFPKSRFYNVFMQLNRGKPVESLFTTQNAAWHQAIKRPVSSAYSMTKVTDYEPHVDDMLRQLIRRLSEEYCSDSRQPQTCDLGAWIHFFSFDVMAEMTWSSALGFIEAGEDVGHLIRSMESDMDYFATVSQMPWLDNFLRKNPVARYITRKSTTSAQFGLDAIQKRRTNASLTAREEKDFLTKFLAAGTARPEMVDDRAIVSYMVTNLVAGSDTTAISIRAVLYYLLKNPTALQRLCDELRDTCLSDTGVVSWADSQKLPYLDACIKEALRMHPAVGVPLERVTPIELTVGDSHQVPAGTVVGVSAWAIHRDPRVYGDRVDHYEPQRWLKRPDESEVGFQERLKGMKRADMTFGYGARTCLGKNIVLMETFKAVPTLLRTFEIELVDPTRDWTTRNSWFVRQAGFKVRLKRRRHSLGVEGQPIRAR